MFDAKKMVRLGLALADFVMSLPAMKEFVLSRIDRKTVALPVRVVAMRAIFAIANMQLSTKDRPITLMWRLA
jgi:hypothetical protein